MKKTLKETIKEFKRLTTEATSTSSSGAYEVPLGYNNTNQTPIPPCDIKPQLVGSEITPNAPTVDVVDITASSSPVPEGWDEVAFGEFTCWLFWFICFFMWINVIQLISSAAMAALQLKA